VLASLGDYEGARKAYLASAVAFQSTKVRGIRAKVMFDWS